MKNEKTSCSADIIIQHLTNPEIISDLLNQFFVSFLTQDLLESAGMQKRSGVAAQTIIRDLLSLRLNNISIASNTISLNVETHSSVDAVYNYQKYSKKRCASADNSALRVYFKSLVFGLNA